MRYRLLAAGHGALDRRLVEVLAGAAHVDVEQPGDRRPAEHGAGWEDEGDRGGPIHQSVGAAGTSDDATQRTFENPLCDQPVDDPAGEAD